MIAQHINEVTPDVMTKNGDSSYVFSIEDVLTIQNRQRRYSSEYSRRESLFAMLLEIPDDGEGFDSTCGYWLDEDAVDNAISSWSADPFDVKK